MKRWTVAAFAVFAAYCASALASAWQPAGGHLQISFWPHAAPDAESSVGPEDEAATNAKLIAGKPWVFVGNVLSPTITVYSPMRNNTGAAMVVFPGGGYTVLASTARTSFPSLVCMRNLPGIRNRDRIRCHRLPWRMRSGRLDSSGFAPRSGTSIRTKSE
jgi:hypothetical protein